jgi:hypothetical protein
MGSARVVLSSALTDPHFTENTMNTRILFASLALCAASLAQAQSAPAPAAPAAAPAMNADAGSARRMDPATFAQHKQKLLDTRAKTTACIQAANDTRALMGCLKAEHEFMKSMHGQHKEHREHAPVAPVGAPK